MRPNRLRPSSHPSLLFRSGSGLVAEVDSNVPKRNAVSAPGVIVGSGTTGFRFSEQHTEATVRFVLGRHGDRPIENSQWSAVDRADHVAHHDNCVHACRPREASELVDRKLRIGVVPG